MKRLIATAGEDMGTFNELKRPRNPHDEHRAALIVVTYAHDKKDALYLLRMLGLYPSLSEETSLTG